VVGRGRGRKGGVVGMGSGRKEGTSNKECQMKEIKAGGR